jgi:hypothetical protein
MSSRQKEQLFQAIRNGDEDLVKSFVAEDNELLEARDERGTTPLIMATYLNNGPVAEYLLASGAEVDARDGIGNTALMGVAFKGYPDVAQMLIAKGADVNALSNKQATPLIYAAMFNQGAVVDLLLANGADPSLQDDQGMSAADHARAKGWREVAAKL